MSDPRPEYVYRFERRGLFHFLFLLSVLLFAWVLVVLYGESEGWGDDPGRWALLPAIGWALIGLAVFAIFIAYALAQLIIRERPGQIYRLEGVDTGTGTTPAFLHSRHSLTSEGQPAEGEPLPETVAEADTEERPGQA